MTDVSERPGAGRVEGSESGGSEAGSGRVVEAFVLGAGVCGVAAAIRMQDEGLTDIVIADRAPDIGGTWHHNTYPGCACDIPSHLYSFSFAPNPDWSRIYSPQAEIKNYLRDVADEFGVSRFMRFGVEVLRADWNSRTARWDIVTSAGDFHAQFFVIAAGPLHAPMIPDLPGIDSFEGTSFHSSTWPADLDVEGLDVVAIGTGASAVQFVPAVQPAARSVKLVQRTPSWVFPKPDWEVSGLHKRLLRLIPGGTKLERWGWWALMDFFLSLVTSNVRIARMMGAIGRWHIRRHIADPATREALTPKYAVGCKRLCFSNDYYRAIAQPNVELVTSPAVKVGPRSVVTADGRELPADVIVYGTGFHTLQNHPVNGIIRGRDGRSLDEVWQGSPTAHMGTTVPGFPNAFVMFGPNVGTLSGFVMAEAQADYLAGALQAVREEGLAGLDMTEVAHEGFVRAADETLATSVWALGGCDSYYLSTDGRRRVSLPWPHSMTALRRRLRRFDGHSYERVCSSSSSSLGDKAAHAR